MGQTYKVLYVIFCLLLVSADSWAQNTVVQISKDKFDYYEELHLDDTDGWIYHTGNDTTWAGQEIDLSEWKKLKPTQLSVNDADQDGRVEGWFRLKVRIDGSLENEPLFIYKRSKDASEIFIDGKLIMSYGRIGSTRETYKASIDNGLVPIPVTLSIDSTHIIAIHVLDYAARFPHVLISKLAGNTFFGIGGKKYFDQRTQYWKHDPVYKAIWLSIGGLLCSVFWLMVFLDPSEKSLRVIAICSTLNIGMSLSMTFFDLMGLSFSLWRTSLSSLIIFVYANLTFIPLAVSQIFINSISKKLRYTSLFIFLLGVINVIEFYSMISIIIATVFCFSVSLYIVIKHWKTLKGAQWSLVVGILFMVLCLILLLAFVFSSNFGLIPVSVETLNIITTGVFLSLPISMVVYVTIRFKEIINEVRDKAEKVVQMANEKRELVASQNKVLEFQVQERTFALQQSLENLKSTQAQLIQSEKMASLGELTAGIAHEIQNPLNFVNNFSEVNMELFDELETEIEKGNREETNAIVKYLRDNEGKINHHGKKADAIVKSMLQHTRTSTKEKEITDLNALCDESLRLAYHGFRAKDKSFNSEIKFDPDPELPQIAIIPQDIGRVLLNLINNAFYAVNQKEKEGLESYLPTVVVSTKNLGEKIEIAVKDNGCGIPEEIKDKIFQPFFTSKPTGQGTGLGLSLSYDIVKAHGGEIKVETGVEGTKFIVTIPVI